MLVVAGENARRITNGSGRQAISKVGALGEGIIVHPVPAPKELVDVSISATIEHMLPIRTLEIAHGVTDRTGREPPPVVWEACASPIAKVSGLDERIVVNPVPDRRPGRYTPVQLVDMTVDTPVED